MAVTHNLDQLQLQLKFQTGTNSSGNPVYSTRTYSSVNTAATYDQFMEIGQAMADLCTYPVDTIYRSQRELLLNS